VVYGVDIEEKAIAKAKENKKKENISNVEFVLSSGELMDKTWEKKFDWKNCLNAMLNTIQLQTFVEVNMSFLLICFYMIYINQHL
jgi:ubiquinone/menaquinone biosynthesis C-methylase UbiE